MQHRTDARESSCTAVSADNMPVQKSAQITAQKSLWHYIVSDLKRYKVTDKRSTFTALIMCPGASACIVFRIGHWMWTYNGIFAPLVRLGFPFYILLKRFSEIVNGISIQPQASVGEGLYIGHGGSVHIGGKAVLGSNCNLSQEVTIGVAGRGDRRGTPHVGDRVYIGAGAKLLGLISIGNDTAIGANAVVTKSLADRAVAVGIPARIISYEGSFEFITYEGMEEDPDRLESFHLREHSHTEEWIE